jgi:subtilisin family serine protease
VLRLRWLIGCLAMANPASLAAVQHLEKNPTVIEKVRRLEETTATGLKPYLVKWLDQPGASEYAYDVVMPLVESMTNDANLAGFVASLVQSISGQFYNGLSAMLSDEAASFFNKSDAVQGVYPDVMMRMHVTEDTADDNRYHRLRFPASEDSRLARHLQAGTTSAPEKKQSGAPYQLGRIDERNDARTGEYFYTDVGTGVDIYVLDSGINFNHEEFTGRICTECAANFARDQPATDASDCNGHGTHVAALAAGTKFGPAKDATIIPIRVYDCSNAGPLSQVIQGINHVLATKQSRKRPSVVNMSFGGERSSLLDEAVNALTANNIFVVVAAGTSDQARLVFW